MKRILIQAGHTPPREPGFEAGTGTVREQEFAAKLQKELLLVFADDARFLAIPAPGRIPREVVVDAALYLHGDGSASHLSTGFCFGFPEEDFRSSALANYLRLEIQKIPGVPVHRKDNYTRDLAGYYGFRRTKTEGPTVLVEHGFLTNPAEQAWMFKNIAKLARAEYAAVCRYFGLRPLPVETPAQNRKRLAALRTWILKMHTAGWGWKRIKASPNWREFRRRGGQ